MNRFELLTDPLTPGVAVIEASAGTGKTFTLAGLVLRMLLEPNGSAPPPGIDQLLVVTYTNAATDELRARIRARLQGAVGAFEAGTSSDPLAQALLTRFSEPEAKHEALRRLQDALTLFDQAAIFTIHGFCQRVLKDRAFETEGLFDAELAADTSELVRAAALDFIRSQVATASPDLLASGLAHLLTPALLLQAARAVQSQVEFTVEPAPQPGAALEVTQRRAALLACWRAQSAAICNLFGGGRGNAWFKSPYNTDTYAAKVTTLFERLEQGEAWTKDLADDLGELAWSEVSTKVGKNKPLPESTFFRLVEDFLTARETLGRSWQAEFVAGLHATLADRQRRAKTLSFDDLLRRTDAALTAPQGGDLIATLRRTYRAALIDEFQDTDLLQWRIFRTLFAAGDTGHRLRLIGDPKQAIYGFRGADVATYLAARESVPAEARWTLATNWRSERQLVAAVNHLFGSHPEPFANEQIQFVPVAAAGRAEASALVDPDASAPLQLWLLGETPEDQGLSIDRATTQSQEAMLGEIERLLSDPAIRLDGERIRPRDIAILVPQNFQAIALQAKLRRRGIPSVLQAAESVFASDEATTLEHFLAALEAPHSDGRLRRLLATPAMGFTLEQFARLDADTAFASAVAEAFAAHVKRWQTQGFAAACRSWLDGEGVRARLMTLPDGERRLTNLLHLGELLQHAEQDGRTGAGLLRWLTEQKQTDKQTLEEAEMRLESDASAVRLVTVHKSKGLEYPIVFCAFLWRGVEPSRTRKENPLVVRRPGEAPLLDLHGYSHSAHQLAADSATLQEHLRLLYVALTRARNRCYLLTGPINGLATSALGWLLHARSAEPTLENLGAHVKTLTRATMHAELQTLAAATEGTVALVTELPRLNATPSGWNTAPPPMGPARVYRRGDFERWRIQSYSGLIAGAADEAPDHDPDELPMDPRPTEAPDEFSLLPRGTTLGTCLHAILEQLDFTADPADWTTLVDDTLRRHQLAPELWRDTTLRLLQRLTAAPLITPAGAFTLRAVSNRNRLNELEFFLPSRQFNVPALQRVFARHADQIPVPDWSARVANLTFEKADGFLHGYMDTIIEHAGRFYLFDWKTNWLGPNASTYEPGTVQRAMRSGFYVLQYHLYAVALRRYLRLRLGATDFGSVWGGVFYSFLRGVDPAQPGQGWFFHRPGEALLDELESVLESGGEL